MRAWAEPTHPGNSKVTVETLYRPLADPSLPERELDRQVPRDHPVAIKVRAALQDAASVAGLLVTTEAMVAELPKDKPSMPAMPPGGGMGGMDF